MTLAECGIQDLLKSGAYEFLDRTVMDPQEVYRRTFSADVFLTSANAITEEGELYNVDGNGNRVAALIYGPQRVIVVAGVNKIVRNLEEAISRVKYVAAPANGVRLGTNTPAPTQAAAPSARGHDRRLRLGKADVLPVCGHRLPAHRPHPGGAGRGGAGLLKPLRTGSLWARRTQKCGGRPKGAFAPSYVKGV